MKRSTIMWLTIALTFWIKLGQQLYYHEYFIGEWWSRSVESKKELNFALYLSFSFVILVSGLIFLHNNYRHYFKKLNRYIDEN